MQFEVPFTTDDDGAAELPFDILTDDAQRYDGLVYIDNTAAKGHFLRIVDCEPNKSFKVIIRFDDIPAQQSEAPMSKEDQ